MIRICRHCLVGNCPYKNRNSQNIDVTESSIVITCEYETIESGREKINIMHLPSEIMNVDPKTIDFAQRYFERKKSKKNDTGFPLQEFREHNQYSRKREPVQENHTYSRRTPEMTNQPRAYRKRDSVQHNDQHPQKTYFDGKKTTPEEYYDRENFQHRQPFRPLSSCSDSTYVKGSSFNEKDTRETRPKEQPRDKRYISPIRKYQEKELPKENKKACGY